jgi:WD40 repeat protein
MWFVTASGEIARLWDAETGRQIGDPFVGHTLTVVSAAFSPDGKRIVTASEDKTARLWDAETHKQVGKLLVGQTELLASAVFSPDGKRIITASAKSNYPYGSDWIARLWDAQTGKPIGEPLVRLMFGLNSIAFSPDSKRLVTATRRHGYGTHRPVSRLAR